MMFRPSQMVVGALSLMVAACGSSDNLVQVNNTATVRLVNDTDMPISVIGSTAPAFVGATLVGATLDFGQATDCAVVELSGPAPGLMVKNAVTGMSLAVTRTLSAGSDLTIVAFDDAAGDVQLATLDNRFAPQGADAGLRLFNGVSTTGPLFMERSGVLTPLVGFGAVSPFFSVSPDSTPIVVANHSSTIVGEGVAAAPPGRNSTVFVGPAAPGTIRLRVFTVPNCVGNEA